MTRWLDRYGFERTEKWVQFNNEPAPLTLSVNRLRATRTDVRKALAVDDVECEKHGIGSAWTSRRFRNPLRQPSHQQFLSRQDEASQLVPLAVDAQPAERVLDLCAAPGGKTVMMAGDMHDTGVLVACDVRARRVALLRDTVRQAGEHHAYPMHVPAEGALPFMPILHRVLVDAPCSGLGTVRRDPDIKWRRNEDELAGLAERQVVLLRRAATVLKPGGRLVYATCSSEPDENEMVVD